MAFRPDRLSAVLVAGIGTMLAGGLPAGMAQEPEKSTPGTSQQIPGDAVTRGEYLFNIGGCLGCHTDGQNGERLAGGRALKPGTVV